MTRIAINYEPTIADLIGDVAARGLISGLEIIPDSYAHENVDDLQALLARYRLPYAFHFVDLSLGSADFRTNHSLDAYARMVRTLEPAHCSDHLTCCRASAIDLRQNLGVPRTADMLEIFVDNIRRTRRRFGPRPFLVENIASQWEFRASNIDRAEFYCAVLERSGAAALLDVHNLYADELNFGTDPIAIIDRIPAERIVEVHVSGGTWSADRATYNDSHNFRVPPRVFDLLRYVVQRRRPPWVVFERVTSDRHLRRLSREIVEDLETINRIIEPWTQHAAPRSRASKRAG